MRLVMMGTGTFAEPTFEALLASDHPIVGLVTQPDRSAGDKRGSTRQVGKGMKQIALERGIPVYQPESINTPEGVQQVMAWKPDLLVVAAYGQILSKDVLGTTDHGGINVHASLLPKYRGAAPVAWAIWNGETETGVTIIRMSVHLDAGDMLAQEKLTIGPEETTGEVEACLAPLGARLALAVINQMAIGMPVPGLKQDKAQASKAPKLTKELGLIDWSRPARTVCNQIRAMHPWPTAYTYLHHGGQAPLRLIVHRTRPSAAIAGEPGFVHAVPGQFLVSVGGGEGVEILEVQPAGKKRMAGDDFARGHELAGARLGPPLSGDDASPKQ